MIMTRAGRGCSLPAIAASIAAAMFFAVSAQAQMPPQPAPLFQSPFAAAPQAQQPPAYQYSFRETMKDVDPGVDHGNSDANLPDEFKKQIVFYRSQELPGTIIIDTQERHLYLIKDPTHAVRYGIGVGRDGFTWQGLLQITRKSEWPDWHPPPEMIERQPYLPRFMAGGPGNPLGARAMYLGNTVYRIHGTNAPETIGQAVSSGCFRLVNDDVADLYDRVNVGTKVIVRQN
jgi:lipoprotein-anchoring transpeptidase ErfK/SrfK